MKNLFLFMTLLVSLNGNAVDTETGVEPLITCDGLEIYNEGTEEKWGNWDIIDKIEIYPTPTPLMEVKIYSSDVEEPLDNLITGGFIYKGVASFDETFADKGLNMDAFQVALGEDFEPVHYSHYLVDNGDFSYLELFEFSNKDMTIKKKVFAYRIISTSGIGRCKAE